ncbi:hypothetical protein EDD18DRAFT_1195801 [Armillaria luteobubalina]|uniref:Uncharacterized protein n=1 Tax=Armillaria luteobubalina TaxID=153913 RepID=A0AA39UDR8_9AGAR|nr:hypothetical protein EDD18DRAFT_1195801 [Armillaria luteobubalina]
MYCFGRNDLRGIIDDMMAYKVYKALGLFPFSEVGHGLDIANLCTTATLFPGGGFELHTTCLVAARYTCRRLPVLGKPAFGIINDGKDIVLPGRNGSFPFNHTITMFHRVQLPLSALLGELDNSVDIRLSLWHVGVGAISLSAIAITCLKVASTNVYRYSLSCHVGVPPPIPIISFRTQQIPIFTAVAQVYRDVIYFFYDASIVLIQQSNMRGMSMAEGDVFVLCIQTLNSNSLLAKHMYTPPIRLTDRVSLSDESAIFNKYTTMVKEHGYRGDHYHSFIPPQLQMIIEWIGHRMAYDAAVTQGIPQALIEMDVGWYIEAGVLTQDQVASMEDRAMKATFPHMNQWVDSMGVSDYLKAPILPEVK